MLYREIQPPKSLAPFVKLIWLQEDDSPDPLAPPLHIVADGIVEWVFHYGAPFTTIHTDGRENRQPHGFAVAQLNEPIAIRPTGKTGILAVRFHPWGAYHFLSEQIRGFGDQIVPLEHLFRSSGRNLTERIQSAESNDTRIRIIVEFLTRQIGRHHRNEPSTDRIVRFMRQTRGRHTIRELGRVTGWTERSLQRKCLSSLGVGPKHFSSLARFLTACQTIREADLRNMTEVACECGYFDQAHFNRDFRRFSGVTPAEFMRNENIVFDAIE